MNIKQEIGLRIQEARKKNKMSAVDLSKLTGFNKSRISNWENGRRTPGLDEAKILEDALRVPAAYLLCMDFDDALIQKFRLIEKDYFYKIPLYDIGNLNNGFLETPNNWIPIPHHLETLLSPQIFAFQLNDYSMGDLYKKNDIIILEKDVSPIHGDYILLKINTSNTILFRKIYIDDSPMDNPINKFCALNNDWPEITTSSDTQFTILGVMKNHLTIFF
jgi:transcriptional regulator with XRE-family HTH domain